MALHIIMVNKHTKNDKSTQLPANLAVLACVLSTYTNRLSADILQVLSAVNDAEVMFNVIKYILLNRITRLQISNMDIIWAQRPSTKYAKLGYAKLG